MTIARASIIRGPAVVIYDSVTYYSESDIVVTPKIDTFKIPSSVNGDEDERLSDIMFEISFTPVGSWANAKALINSFATPSIGSSLFGSTDKNLVIHSVAGQTITYNAAAITSIPNLRFSTVKTMLESVTFTAIGKNATEWTDAAKRIVTASATFSDTSHDPDDVLTQPYSIAWGSSPYNAMESEDGVTVSFALALQPAKTDRDGTLDMTIEGVEVMARFIPVGLTEAQLITLMRVQGAGAARGSSLGANSNTLVIAGTGVYCAIYGASPKGGLLRFGRTVLRTGEVPFVATRRYTDGALQPLYLLADAAPE